MTRWPFLALFLLAACGSQPPAPPTTVASVDLARYSGRWHEVARLPQRFQDSSSLRCEEVTATYQPAAGGEISVLNECVNALDPARPRRMALGSAYPVAGSQNARLKVTFFWPFYGDYWVLGLDPDYRWAVVGTPDRRNLWILSRTPELPPAEMERALGIARAQGYDLSGLIRAR
ncbi:lipocalin family protein [Roseococcus sp. YIM B11640]|uniref:lipocalin family protein n=1 Tax=Roseococcus sp. YIM B11640 TaxID=3133973 RepID=UPI003C7ECB96